MSRHCKHGIIADMCNNPECCPLAAATEKAKARRSATACSLEVEINESRRRYITIEVTQEVANRICEWTMKYNPTAAEEQAAIEAVKAAKVLKEEIMHDTYELGSVDFPENVDVLSPAGEKTPNL